MLFSFGTKATALLGACLALALIVPSAQASTVNLVANGQFENGTHGGGPYVTLPTGSNAMSDWTVSAGTVDWIGTYWDGSGPGADKSVDLSGNSLGAISQTITGLVANQVYQLSFDLARNKDLGSVQTMIASLGGFTSATMTATTDAPNWTSFVMTFLWTGPASSVLTLSATTSVGCCYGPAIDNVALSAVPVPPAAILFLSGLAGLTALGRRRRSVPKKV